MLWKMNDCLRLKHNENNINKKYKRQVTSTTRKVTTKSLFSMFKYYLYYYNDLLIIVLKMTVKPPLCDRRYGGINSENENDTYD